MIPEPAFRCFPGRSRLGVPAVLEDFPDLARYLRENDGWHLIEADEDALHRDPARHEVKYLVFDRGSHYVARVSSRGNGAGLVVDEVDLCGSSGRKKLSVYWTHSALDRGMEPFYTGFSAQEHVPS